MTGASGICEAVLFRSQPIAAAECMPPRGDCGQIAQDVTIQDVSVRKYARFPCKRLGVRALKAGDRHGPSNFLSWDTRHFGLAFYVERALQIANEA
jgi:hypothetical protein